MQPTNYDVIIIGGGVVGCAIASELAQSRVTVAVLEKEPDVGWGTSCRNSGVVHAGFNNAPGSLMARLCVAGNQSFERLCRDLDVPYQKQGKLVVARNQAELATLTQLQRQGAANGVRRLEIIDATELHRLEPQIRGIAALYSPDTAITAPYQLTIALAEQAVRHGVAFWLNTCVQGIQRQHRASSLPHRPGFAIRTNQGIFTATYIVNSAGLYADRIAALAGVRGYRIYPCRGEYHILDKTTAALISRPVYPAPVKGAGGLGVHFTTTIGGVLLIGPSAEYLRQRQNFATTPQIMKRLFAEAQDFLPPISAQTIIRSYAGLRAKQTPATEGGFRDFVIQAEPNLPHLINLIGIESPGLTSAAPIAALVAAIIDRREHLTPNAAFQPRRTGLIHFAEQPEAVQRALIQQHPDYGEIVCRCEHVTRHEVRAALDNPLGARTLHSIKYRTRAMMGRCQGGYCLPRLVELLTTEYGVTLPELALGPHASALFTRYRDL